MSNRLRIAILKLILRTTLTGALGGSGAVLTCALFQVPVTWKGGVAAVSVFAAFGLIAGCLTAVRLRRIVAPSNS